ncbi:3D domain-containing protein [Metabacillus halosaccharovorans]|uniref:3D domain-containing protein n=1 Tax=Metabacillus halosaccharovorans TaxID=930124 RepID=UPI000995390D|nr:3D domain-containing protein [Metabacillus halosaccharovorans]
MKRKLISFITFASLTAGFSVQAAAEEITVKEGDTLWDIAEQNEVEVEHIKEWNNLSSDKILPEDQLVLNDSHEVKLGDTLWDIAEEYEVDIDELEQWNNLDSHIIKPGEELQIKHSETKKDTTEPAATTVKKVQKVKNTETTETEQEPEGQEMTVTATAYTANCEGCSGTTATGINLNANPDKKVIAVDPSVIPLGSTVEVEGYGTAVAADTGGAIKGNKIDVFIPSKSDAVNWGRKKVKIKVLD